MSDIDTVVMDSLKVLDPNRPIREADMGILTWYRHTGIPSQRHTTIVFE